jgi:fido (protein-threonine AMPylation protein)
MCNSISANGFEHLREIEGPKDYDRGAMADELTAKSTESKYMEKRDDKCEDSVWLVHPFKAATLLHDVCDNISVGYWHSFDKS